MKRVLFYVGALMITQSASGMEWGNSKNGYTEISSPKEHPYCWTDSCAKDNLDDAQTLQNLQSTLLIEAELCYAKKIVAQDTMICDLSAGNHHQTNEIASQPSRSHSINAQIKPTIVITAAKINGTSALISYQFQTHGQNHERRTSIIIDLEQPMQIPEKDFIIKLSACLASSKPGTRK